MSSKVVCANNNFSVYCIPRPPAAAQPNKGTFCFPSILFAAPLSLRAVHKMEGKRKFDRKANGRRGPQKTVKSLT